MIAFDPLHFTAVAFVACGLLAVILELTLRDPSGLWDMIDDVRHFAEATNSGERPTERRVPSPAPFGLNSLLSGLTSRA